MDAGDSVLQRLAELKASDRAEALGRLAAIGQAMTPEWRAAMEAKAAALTAEASSPRSKLPKLYSLMEALGEIRAPHVSCKAGCGACCRTIPVEISDLEARHIAAATGRAMVQLPPGRHTQLGHRDTACPFLVDERCSIYAHRPYACRSLAALDTDALTCSDENTALTRAGDPRAVPVVMHRMQMFDGAYRHVTLRKGTTWADIRTFFPQDHGERPRPVAKGEKATRQHVGVL